MKIPITIMNLQREEHKIKAFVYKRAPPPCFHLLFTSILCGFVWTCAKSENQLLCSGKTTSFFLGNMSIKMHVVVHLCLYVNNSADKNCFSLCSPTQCGPCDNVCIINWLCVCVRTLQVSHQWVSGMCCWERVQMVLRRRCVPTRVCCLWTLRSETPTSPSWPLAYALTTLNGSRLLWLTTSATSSAWKTGEVWY